jgi:ATP-binding cassette subfamily B protein/subfamily B ATP-binding cassette protein MsbA
LLLTVALVAFDTLKPWPVKLAIDNVLSRHPLPPSAAWIGALPGAASPSGMLAWLTAGIGFLFLAAWLSRMARSYIQTGLGNQMSYDLGAELFNHLQRLSLRFHGRHPTGDLVQRVTSDCTCASELAIHVVIPLLTSLVSLVAMFTLMWRLDALLTVVAVLAAPLLAIVIKMLAGPMSDRRYEQSVLEGSLMGMAEQTLTALPIVQAFGREAHEDMCFQQLSLKTGRAYLRTIAAEVRFQVSTGAVMAAGTAAGMALGGYHVLQGRLTIGSLLVLLSYLTSLYAPMETLAWLSSGFASAAGRGRRVFELLDFAEDVRNCPGARPVPAIPSSEGAHVRIEDVTFGYDSRSPVLKRLNLDVRPGETVALVGATGAGKSTLAALLMRFYDPDQGRITLQGIDIRELQLASLRAQFAVLLQECLLLPLTVADNIAYGSPGATREQIIEAAIAANADGFIRALPRGYDTVLGERGATLSGGERQRIAITRALLKKAPILILDEPTSALDSETEFLILEELERLMRGRTTFIIAHRLSTVRRAERIVVLERGEVVGSGTHEQLLSSPGLYRNLYNAQLRHTSISEAADAEEGLTV